MQTHKQQRTLDPPQDLQFVHPLTPTQSPICQSYPHQSTPSIQFSQQQVIQIMNSLSSKNSRLMLYFANNKQLLEEFRIKYMYQNPYVKIGIRKILYDLANQRKIGKGLKGLSKLVLADIQKDIWPILELEVKIFMKDEQLKKFKSVLQRDPDQVFVVNF